MSNMIENRDITRMHPEGIFKLFATCIPVRGALNSAIYDLNRLRMVSFPTPYIDLLERLQQVPLHELLEQHIVTNDSANVSAFIDYLCEAEIGSFTMDPEVSPELVREWDAPSIIENAIIDVDEQLHDFAKCIAELDALGCEFLQVRAFSNAFSMSHIRTIVEAARHSSIRSIELFLRYQAEMDEGLDEFMRENHIITRVVIHSAPATYRKELFAAHEMTDGIGQKELEFFMRTVSSCESCGYISAKDIKAPTLEHFMEYSMYNGCLNRKIAIDVQGEIKNCPSFSNGYGNIAATRLSDVVKNAEFQQVWHMKKDDIDICKDCELRYACSDCRAYTVGNETYGKPLRCGYDPYTGVWNEPNLRQEKIASFSQEKFS